jgi:hypothetical protein
VAYKVLELLDERGDLSNEKVPCADEPEPISHDEDDAVPPLGAASTRVLQEKGVAEDVAALVIAKKQRALSGWAHLAAQASHTRLSHCAIHVFDA